MKKIKSKIALVLALVCFISSAFGEESGLFLGLGFGAHGAKQSIKSTKLLDENGLKIRAMQSATDFGGRITLATSTFLTSIRACACI